ncbi:MAG: GNAT family protein [Psychroserpens sp.]|uniref:GNAT family N-acetyltransferase n=1 Tax=Psychroserpens sp. TaxID=2020870 RepID=UPI003C97A9C7
MIAQFDGFEINPIHEGDAWKICDFVISNENRLKRYFPKTLEQNLNPTLSQLYVEEHIRAFKNKDSFVFTVKHSETRKFAALIIIKELDWNIKQGELAYAVDYNFKGQGLVSKAIAKLSAYAFENLHLNTLQIITHQDNLPSVKVAINNGFKWKKTLKNEFRPIGEETLDMELYELFKS